MTNSLGPAQKFIEKIKEAIQLQKLFKIKTIKPNNKSGTSVYLSITTDQRRYFALKTTHSKKYIPECDLNFQEICRFLKIFFCFSMTRTSYITPEKKTLRLYFSKIQHKLYIIDDVAEFAYDLRNIFSNFNYAKYISHSIKNGVIKVNFKCDGSPGSAGNILYSLTDKYLFDQFLIREVKEGHLKNYTYLLALKRKRHSLQEFGFCKGSSYLIAKYVKIIKGANRWLRIQIPSESINNFDKFNESIYISNKPYSLTQQNIIISTKVATILTKEEIYVEQGKTDKIDDKKYLWIPTTNQLYALIDRLDKTYRFPLCDYSDWRTKHKLSYKSEEINLLAFYMYSEFKVTWNQRFWEWGEGSRFEINENLWLHLEDSETVIYVGKRKIKTCKYLLMNFSEPDIYEYDEFTSIDEISNYYSKQHERKHHILKPEEEFQGHCSNLQAWYENDYDTRILDMRLAFPILKALTNIGDPKAKKVFKDEIATRMSSNYPAVMNFLSCDKYLSHFTDEELETLSYKIDFSTMVFPSIKCFFRIWISKTEDYDKKIELQKKCDHILDNFSLTR